jgi:hypothetical protein
VSRRFAVAVALIAGLLGMHGFTSGHGSMPPSMTDGMSTHAVAAQPMTGEAMAMATSLTDGSAHTMGALCLAILAGLGWLLLTLLIDRRACQAAPSSGHLRGYARAAEPAPPSLSELCVLRT